MAKRRRRRKSRFEGEDEQAVERRAAGGLTAELEAQVERWASEAARAYGLLLIDVESMTQGRWHLRVYVDRAGHVEPGQGVGVDECADVSRYIEAYMDADERVPEAYVLEVSSPGVERPLKTRRHVRQAVGKRVQLVVTKQVRGRNKIIGELSRFEGDVLSVNLEGDDEPVEVDWADVKKAQLKYDFDF